jgi:hypothetical protein
MRMLPRLFLVALLLLALSPVPVSTGMVKISHGSAWIERAGIRVTAQVGAFIHEADVLATGHDGGLGVTFSDDSIVSIGPNTALSISKYTYNPATQQGTFQLTLLVGTLSMMSGRMSRESPEALRVRTPRAMIQIRGTEFTVRVEGSR